MIVCERGSGIELKNNKRKSRFLREMIVEREGILSTLRGGRLVDRKEFTKFNGTTLEICNQANKQMCKCVDSGRMGTRMSFSFTMSEGLR